MKDQGAYRQEANRGILWSAFRFHFCLQVVLTQLSLSDIEFSYNLSKFRTNIETLVISMHL